MHEGCADGADAEHERDGRDKPSWTDDFADHVGGDLKQDVRDVKD